MVWKKKLFSNILTEITATSGLAVSLSYYLFSTMLPTTAVSLYLQGIGSKNPKAHPDPPEDTKIFKQSLQWNGCIVSPPHLQMKHLPIRKTGSANKLMRELTKKPDYKISYLSVSFGEWIATGTKICIYRP